MVDGVEPNLPVPSTGEIWGYIGPSEVGIAGEAGVRVRGQSRVYGGMEEWEKGTVNQGAPL